MISYTPDLTSPVVLVTPQDTSEVCDYTILWGDVPWATLAVRRVGDRISPVADHGIALVCVTPGISGALEPTWGSVAGAKITDGTAIWKVTYTLPLLEFAETVTTSTWSCDVTGVTLTAPTHTFKACTTFVSTIPSTATQIVLTNKIVTSNATPRTYERSIIIPVTTTL